MPVLAGIAPDHPKAPPPELLKHRQVEKALCASSSIVPTRTATLTISSVSCTDL